MHAQALFGLGSLLQGQDASPFMNNIMNNILLSQWLQQNQPGLANILGGQAGAGDAMGGGGQSMSGADRYRSVLDEAPQNGGMMDSPGMFGDMESGQPQPMTDPAPLNPAGGGMGGMLAPDPSRFGPGASGNFSANPVGPQLPYSPMQQSPFFFR